MPTMKRIIISLAIICYFTNNNYASIIVQEETINTSDFFLQSNIKSVKIHKLGWELSEPLIELNSYDKLLLTFDNVSERPSSYSYSVVHCDSNWEPSSLFLNDYIDGFEINEIRDYSFSSGTIQSYMHCRLELPNEDLKLKISGNYLLRIFDTYNPENILIQRRFVVYEPLVGINANVRQPSAGEKRYTSQQLDLIINIGRIRVTDPNSEIKTIICQNHFFQGCHENIKPTHIRGNELDYSQPNALIFDGGNEYRVFDTKSIRYLGQGIQSIDYYGGEFHIQLKTDESRRRNRYTYYPDFNGKYVINLENSPQSSIEADYVWTYFTLKTPMELDEGKSVFLFGELTGWELSPYNRMVYNPESGSYEIRILLKQGAYNYLYLVGDSKTGEVDITHFEGSYYDTENSYFILVYYKPLGSRFDRVVGYQRISTRR
jgi:hypothetical protein